MSFGYLKHMSQSTNMREIIFRGKRLDNGEWVYGSFLKDPNGSYITDGNKYILDTRVMIEVDPATVGQYTGLKDKEGKKIFEHDVVERPDLSRKVHVVRYENERFALYKGMGDDIDTQVDCDSFSNPVAFETVLGNLHDSPELLK